MERMMLKKNAELIRQPQPWGELTWYADAALGNSAEMTVGCCMLEPGQANPVHSHPNCAEILVVRQGRIRHTWNDGQDLEMSAGDTIAIPAGVKHQARNIGPGRAELTVVFSSANRQTRGE